jgi:F-type H+-transporting ATPase subunit epsilon
MSQLDRLQLELVLPDKLVASKLVDMVIIAGTEGDFGVLPEHAPLVSSIRPGLLEIHDSEKTEKFFLAGGFVEVLSNQVSILASELCSLEDIDISSCKDEIENLKKQLNSSQDEKEKSLIQNNIDKLEVKITLIK